MCTPCHLWVFKHFPSISQGPTGLFERQQDEKLEVASKWLGERPSAFQRCSLKSIARFRESPRRGSDTKPSLVVDPSEVRIPAVAASGFPQRRRISLSETKDAKSNTFVNVCEYIPPKSSQVCHNFLPLAFWLCWHFCASRGTVARWLTTFRQKMHSFGEFWGSLHGRLMHRLTMPKSRCPKYKRRIGSWGSVHCSQCLPSFAGPEPGL